MDTQAIKSSIMPQVVLFELNGTEVVYRSDGIEFNIIKDPDDRIFFLAKTQSKVESLKHSKRSYTPNELMDAFIAFVLSFLDEYFRNMPLVE